MDDFFALPAFDASAQLMEARRKLRALPGLTEQHEAFAWRGRRVAELTVDGHTLVAALARRPLRQPGPGDWDRATLSDSAQLRRWLEDVKRRVATWEDDEH